jgi:protocatechuate 3,4-dioxygenase beta subunit
MTERLHPFPAPREGRSINRRQALIGLGSAGIAALLAACGKDSTSDTGAASSSSSSSSSTGATAASGDVAALLDASGSCAVVPELTEGPYYIDVDAMRSDIREDRQGTPLRLAIRVRNFADCTPKANAVVDIWHCDAAGSYSGFESSSAGANGGGGPGGGMGGPPPGGGGPGGGGGGNSPTDTKRYLRGSQVTGADGVAQFVTIYPGWYQGRTVHVHVKVHVGNNQVVTSQLFFDEAVTKQVYAGGVYASHNGQDTTNAEDGIFAKANLLTPQKSGDGYLAAVNLDVKTA